MPNIFNVLFRPKNRSPDPLLRESDILSTSALSRSKFPLRSTANRSRASSLRSAPPSAVRLSTPLRRPPLDAIDGTHAISPVPPLTAPLPASLSSLSASSSTSSDVEEVQTLMAAGVQQLAAALSSWQRAISLVERQLARRPADPRLRAPNAQLTQLRAQLGDLLERANQFQVCFAMIPF